MLFSTSMYDGFWSQLGPNLGPKSSPKPNREPPKIDPKSHLIFDLFVDRCLLIFDKFSISKSAKNLSQIYPNIIPRAQQQKIKHIDFVVQFSVNLCPRLCYFVYNLFSKAVQNRSKNSSRINTQTWVEHGANLASFWEGFGIQNGAKFAPNRFKNWSSNRW